MIEYFLDKQAKIPIFRSREQSSDVDSFDLQIRVFKFIFALLVSCAYQRIVISRALIDQFLSIHCSFTSIK